MASSKNQSNPQLELAELIGRVARRWHQLAEKSFAALRLNHTEARLLTLLDQHGGDATQDTLSSQLNVDRSNAGRALSHLEESGMVVRRADEADARTKVVEITDSGRAAVKEIAQIHVEMAETLLGNLSKTDTRKTSELLRAVLAED